MKYYTRILFNLDISEVNEFRARLALLDVDLLDIEDFVGPLNIDDEINIFNVEEEEIDPFIVEDNKEPLNIHSDEVINAMNNDIYMDKSVWRHLSFIHGANKEGRFIFCVVIKHLIDGFRWWYPTCLCDCVISFKSGLYYCPSCERHVICVMPRFKLMVIVAHQNGSSIFLLSDNDVSHLLKKSCSELFHEMPEIIGSSILPEIFEGLIGKKILFQVELKDEFPKLCFQLLSLLKLVRVITPYPFDMVGQGKSTISCEQYVSQSYNGEIIQIENDDDDEALLFIIPVYISHTRLSVFCIHFF